MKQALIHKLGETYLTVDITGVTHAQFVPSAQFTSWKMLEEHFLRMGAIKAALDKAHQEVEKNGTAHLAY
jgi:hypothetical protein